MISHGAPIVADCSLEMYEHKVPPLYYNITFLNEPGDRHLPADERGLYSIHLFNFVVLLAGLVGLLLLSWNRITESQSIHIVVVLVGLALINSLLASFYELIHLRSYYYNGMGWPFFNILSSLCEAFSDFVVSFILLAISCGWTLGSNVREAGFGSMGAFHLGHAEDLDSSGWQTILNRKLIALRQTLRSPAQIFVHVNQASIVLVLLLVFYLVLVVWSAWGFDDDFDKFHDHEHLPGIVLMWSRLALCALFTVSATRTINYGAGGDIMIFLRLFRTVGACWFACMPLLCFVGSFFAQYLRHPIVTGGTLIIQSVSICVLTWLVVGSKSTLYYRKSTVGAPSGGLGSASFSLDSGIKTTVNLAPGIRAHCD